MDSAIMLFWILFSKYFGILKWTAVACSEIAKSNPSVIGKNNSDCCDMPLETKYGDELFVKVSDNAGYKNVEQIKLPVVFDARIKWPHCTSIADVKNQGECKSGWAVAVASVITDRMCIQSGNQVKDLSAYHLLACCENCCGCKGGHIINAWKYVTSDGLPTGGSYKKNHTCQPYMIAPCHGPRRQYSHCGWRSDIVPDCWSNKCRSGYNKKEIFRFGTSYQILDYELLSRKNHFAIMREVFVNGPVQVSLHFYDDLRWHTGGIYRHSSGHFEGEHAVKLIGWGQDGEDKYWLLMNSFGKTWCDNGTFKMPKDLSDRCMFGYAIIAPKLNGTIYFNSEKMPTANNYIVYFLFNLILYLSIQVLT